MGGIVGRRRAATRIRVHGVLEDAGRQAGGQASGV